MRSRVHQSEAGELAYIDLRPWDKQELIPAVITRWYLIKAMIWGWRVGNIPGVVSFGIIRREFEEIYVWVRWELSPSPALALKVISVLHDALRRHVRRGTRVWLIGERERLAFLRRIGFRVEAPMLLNWYEPGDYCGMVLDWKEVPE